MKTKVCKIIIKRKYRPRRVDGTKLGPGNLVFQSAHSGKLHPGACRAILPREQRSLHSLPGDGGICWPVTACGKDIYQATQEVKFIAAFRSLFLPDPPGLCLMLGTDGAEEFQVATDGVSFSLFFFSEHIKSSSKSLLFPSIRCLLVSQCQHQIFDPSTVMVLPAPPHDGTIC